MRGNLLPWQLNLCWDRCALVAVNQSFNNRPEYAACAQAAVSASSLPRLLGAQDDHRMACLRLFQQPREDTPRLPSGIDHILSIVSSSEWVKPAHQSWLRFSANSALTQATFFFLLPSEYVELAVLLHL